MKIRRLAALTAFGVTTALAHPVQFHREAGLWFRSESGVETKLMLSGIAGLAFGSRVNAFAGIALAALDNPGIAHYGLGASVTAIEVVKLRFEGQVNHDEWSGWQVGENRVSALVVAMPTRGLDLGVGLAWRAPVFGSASFRSPLAWQSDAPEWNYLYRLDWAFLRRDRAELALWVANHDRLTIHNPQQFPFGLRGCLKTGEHWRLNARLSSDIKGLSGLLLSFGEVDLRFGAGYEF
jgi:hypothetical protein